jgi:hypothetical protein
VVGRALVDNGGRPEFDQLAEVHDPDRVGHVADDGQVVGDHQVGQAVAGLEILHEIQDLGLDGHVEGGYRLVCHDQLGIESQGPGQADTLALTAGELVGIPLHDGAAKPHLVEQGPDLLLLPRSVTHPVDLQGLTDDGADPHARVERGVGVLEHQLQVAPVAAQAAPTHARELDPLEPDRPCVGVLEGDQQAADGRLAATGLTDQAEGLALTDRETHPRHGFDRPHLAAEHPAGHDGELLHQVADPQDGR